MPYLFRNSCASIGGSRVTPIGGVVDIVLVSMNIPFSRRCLLFLQAALPLFLTTILQSAIMNLYLPCTTKSGSLECSAESSG